MKSNLSGCFLLALALSPAAVPADPVQDLLARMDDAAKSFRSMTANLHLTTHIAVIDDNTEEGGTVLMKKSGDNQVEGRIDFTQPPENKRSAIFEKRTAQVYIPKSNILQIYDLGAKGEQIDRFIMLGFGTSGNELAHDYDVKILGPDSIQGQKTTKVELTPKSQSIREGIASKIELWIPDAPGKPYPVQEKVYEKSGDFRTTTYTDMKINSSIPANALKLKTPPGVKVEHPGK